LPVTEDDMSHKLESEVRYYSRVFTDVLVRAEGSHIFTESGRDILDFFSSAGSLNYGHNNPAIHAAVIEYLQGKGLISALDMDTPAKLHFVEKFSEIILKPRGMKYKIQFPGPTGTNAIEASLKLARKATGRKNIFAFMGGFHGMSLGSLSATSNARSREAAGVALSGITFMPYPHGFMGTFDSIQYMEEVLTDSHSGIEKPAAVLVETIQAEGGVIAAPFEWLKRLRELCTRHGILFICDDIQVGCGRTGKFFSAENSGIHPDIIALAKSISGLGLPLSIVLMKEDLDVWKPGEHTGTFRANALSLTGGAAALDFWADPAFEPSINKKAAVMDGILNETYGPMATAVSLRGYGMIRGICIEGPEGAATAAKIAARCYELGLMVERSGREGEVVKLMPALTIGEDDLLKGLDIAKQAVKECVK
jgi:diaminobutyrate-2-oxoglutarate transaminase